MPPSVNHKNEQRKKKGKGAGNTVAAVFPVQTVQPQPQEKAPESIPPVKSIEREPLKMTNPVGSALRMPRSEPVSKGQVVRPQPVSNVGMVGTVADMIQSAIPLSPSSPADTPEKIEWVELQRIPNGKDPSKWVELLVMGLARGFQIWILTEESFWEEVLSERQGPLRVGKLLPLRPERLMGDERDTMGALRPLFAMVDAGSGNLDRPFCTLTMLSLPTGQKMNKLSFDEPISAIQANEKFTVLSLTSSIVVLDSFNLTEQFRVPMCPPSDGYAPATTLCSSLLAYPHPKGEHLELSCGGMSMEQRDHSVTGQMLQAFSSAMTSVSGASGVGNKVVGLIGVVDLGNPSPSSSSSPFTIARFVAHLSPIAHLSFSPDGRCLVSGDEGGSTFHVFLLLPHATSLQLGAVHHLYRLHRGSTPAKVICSSWALDGRWLALTTNHGTSHIYAVCPYGGQPTQRTHATKFANRESRFLRSAGLAEDVVPPTAHIARERTHSGSPLTDKKHVALERGSMARAALNCRVPPQAPPITLHTVKKIRESTLSSDKLSAWAADLTPSALSSGRRISVPSSSRLSILLSHNSVLVSRADGLVCSYELRVPTASSLEDPPRLQVLPVSTWTLTRTKKGDDVRAPLAHTSTLLTALNGGEDDHPQRKISIDAPAWIPQVEVQPYSAPHRRLWLGPQFSFFYYNDDRNSASLVSPAQKSVPVVVGSSMAAVARGEELMIDATRIECGSWTSEKDRFGMGDEGDDIAKAIIEAMKEVEVDRTDESRISDEEFFDTASGGVPKGGKEDLLQFDDF